MIRKLIPVALGAAFLIALPVSAGQEPSLRIAQPEAGAQEPSLRIAQPEAGATIAGPNVRVVLTATGVILGGSDRSGGYVLLGVDDLPPVRCYSDRFTFQGIEVGEHRLRAELRHPDGRPFEPPVASEVVFTVAAGAR